MGVLSATLIAGIIGWFYKKGKPKVEDFREIIGKLGDPILIEKKLTEFLPQAQKLSNNSIYVQILAEIAWSQAMQKKYEQAHQTLDLAESEVRSTDYESQAWILLHRGKVFQKTTDFSSATKFFEESYQLSQQYNLDILIEAIKSLKLFK